jgi:hypothetical protein
MEGGHQAGALNSECKPGCAAGYHHEEKEQSFRCTVVNGTGQWVGGSIECLEGNTDSSGVRPEHAVLITLGVLAVLAIVVYKCLWPRFCAHKSSAPRSLLRESILGSANMPDRQLAAKCARRFHLGCGPFWLRFTCVAPVLVTKYWGRKRLDRDVDRRFQESSQEFASWSSVSSERRTGHPAAGGGMDDAAAAAAAATAPLPSSVSLNRLLDESPWLQFTSECQRLWPPPRLNK